MLVLGIETTCDETAAAIVEGGTRILSSVVSSQVDLHARYGGVVPEIAARAHVDYLDKIVQRALAIAEVRTQELDGVAAARLRAPIFAAVLAELKPRTVLEVGCGNGINLLSLADAFPDVKFTGLDLTAEGIAAAKKLQEGEALPEALAQAREHGSASG